MHDNLKTKNTQITTWKIQNEDIACTAEYVRRNLQVSLSKFSYFLLIADEVTNNDTETF